ncbi:MAG: hypothetical protein AAF665_10265 [Pseudomonadota bacterium]
MSALLARSSTLELQLNCDCPIEAFQELNDFLVLDIRDALSLPEAARSAVSAPLPTSEFAYGDLLWRRQSRDSGEDALSDNTNDSTVSSQAGQQASNTAEIVDETRENLLRSFANAASKGLVDAELPESQIKPIEEPTQQNDEPIFDSSKDQAPAPVEPSEHVRVTSSKDVPADDPVENISMTGAACADPARVALQDWGSDADFAQQIAPARLSAFDEADNQNSTAVLKLIRLYLHFGFGAEANQLLAMKPELQQKYPELTDLADILEYGSARSRLVLNRFSDCASDLALWGILASDPFPTDGAGDRQAALLALEKLPDHIKVFLAQDLGNRFIDMGDYDAASTALRIYDRINTKSGEPPRIATVAILEDKGEIDGASAALAEIITSGTAETPEAIIQKIDRHVRESTPVPADLALLAETYATELRDTEVGEEMYRAFVLATAKSGQFERAFELLSDATLRQPPEKVADLANIVIAELAIRSQDGAFLNAYFTKVPAFEPKLNSETHLQLAKRLWDLDFPDEARRMTAKLPTSLRTESATLARARLLLHDGAYPNALAVLRDFDSQNAEHLRAQAYESLGNTIEARSAYARADKKDLAERTAWLSNDWIDLSLSPSPGFGPAIALTNAPVTQIEPDDEMIQNARALIDEISTARQSVRSMLQAFPVADMP